MQMYRVVPITKIGNRPCFKHHILVYASCRPMSLSIADVGLWEYVIRNHMASGSVYIPSFRFSHKQKRKMMLSVPFNFTC